MGSSASHLHVHWVLLATLCGILYLIFDALRSFALQLSPVRLRQLTGDAEEGSARWGSFDIANFQLVSGALLQVALIVAAGATMMVLDEQAFGTAVFTSVAMWSAIVMVWKFILALIPEDLAELILRTLLPVSHFFYYLFWPLLFPLRKLLARLEKTEGPDDEVEEITDEQVQAYINVGEEEGIIEASEGKLLQSIVDFGDRLAHEIMTPRIDVLAFDAKKPIEELARLFSESKYARIPIYEKSIDQISGIVHIKDLFDTILRGQRPPVASLARPPYFVSETKKVSDLLREFQSEHLQVCVVVDEYGGTAGIITTEDIIEEIVGDIADEHEDEEITLAELGHDVYLVNGMMRVEQLEEKLDADLEGEDYETVAGMIFTTLGRVPAMGEIVTKNGWRFEVDRADQRRIYRVRISKDPDWRPEGEGEED
ncbi:MAG TPA: hemolysin family protein [Thermoanaerobaculia bacterium]